MSRSYKYPIYTDQHSGRKAAKRASNKKLRQKLKIICKGFKSSKFKKLLFCSYNICDWKFDPINKEDKIKAIRK